MLNQDTRIAILQLKERGQSIRAIARALDVDRDSVRTVLRAGTREVPALRRKELAEDWHEEILSQFTACKGNLLRVHEEVVAQGAAFSYQALTGYCRRHGIGVKVKVPSGEYHFGPGEEMQHDTSPHRVMLDGKVRLLQSASLTLCHSRLLFQQYYPTFDRFWCKVFLTEAFKFFGGTCGRCMIDNTNVVVWLGTGKEMIPAPEMAAFAERFGFVFQAHAVGHANRSAQVERNFGYIEGNFLAGRDFKDWEDLNQRARAWCEKANATLKRSIHARPIDLFAQERTVLRPLPLWVPTVYRLEHRTVDTYGYMNVRCNRFSVPWRLVGRRLELRESAELMEFFDGQHLVASHANPLDAHGQKFTLPEHRMPRGEGRPKAGPCLEEAELLRLEPQLAAYVAALKAHPPRRISTSLRRLLAMVRDYPRQPLLEAVATALSFGLFDLDRLDGMVLRTINADYFVLGEAVPLPYEPMDAGGSRER
jgi:transposase